MAHITSTHHLNISSIKLPRDYEKNDSSISIFEGDGTGEGKSIEIQIAQDVDSHDFLTPVEINSGITPARRPSFVSFTNMQEYIYIYIYIYHCH